jgi:hypothetical protein
MRAPSVENIQLLTWRSFGSDRWQVLSEFGAIFLTGTIALAYLTMRGGMTNTTVSIVRDVHSPNGAIGEALYPAVATQTLPYLFERDTDMRDAIDA